VNPEEAASDLRDAMARTLWDELAKSSHKQSRAEPTEEVDEMERKRLATEEILERRFAVSEDSSSWNSVLYQPGVCAGAALRVAGGMLSNAASIDMARFRELAFLFARNTIAQMQDQMLKSTDDQDFLTLSTSHFKAVASHDTNESLLSIVLAGESEAGQSVLRDMIASFLLPKEVVGVRRTLLMSRDVSARIASEFPWIAGAAHETAMMGCENVWKGSSSSSGGHSELKRACALLAGAAMLTTEGSGDDMIRKSNAFNGLIQLPFLECPPPQDRSAAAAAPPRSRSILSLVPSSRSWVLYRVAPSGKPVVELSKRGLDGLCYALLSFRGSFR
jgi:hypothetical protein